MYDRIARYPGRILIAPENGGEPFYATLTLADEPAVEGTKLNKENMLTDSVAALYGLPNTAVPNDVLSRLGNAAFISGNILTNTRGEPISLNTSIIPGIESVGHVSGAYTGNGNRSQTIILGFKPIAVLTLAQGTGLDIYRGSGAHSIAGGLAVIGHYASGGSTNATVAAISDYGFIVYFTQGAYSSSSANTEGVVYNYIAFK